MSSHPCSPGGGESPYCIFCLKGCSMEDKLGSFSKKRGSKKFAHVVGIERFLGVQFRSSGSSGSGGGAFSFQFCPDCELLLGRFAEGYGRLRRIELELEWKVGQIKDIMVAADRVPSRINHLKGSEGGKQMQEWRRQFVKKCVKRQLGSFPRVTLHKLEEEKKMGIEVRRSSPPPPPPFPEENGPRRSMSHLTSTPEEPRPVVEPDCQIIAPHLNFSATPAQPDPTTYNNPLLLNESQSEPILVLKEELEPQKLTLKQEEVLPAEPSRLMDAQQHAAKGDNLVTTPSPSTTTSISIIIVEQVEPDNVEYEERDVDVKATIVECTPPDDSDIGNEMETTTNDDKFSASSEEAVGADIVEGSSKVQEEFDDEHCTSELEPSRSDTPEQGEELRVDDDDEEAENDEDLIIILRPTTTRRLLRAHLRCQKCSRTFSSQANFDSHVETHRRDEDDDDDDDDNLGNEEDGGAAAADYLSSGSESEYDENDEDVKSDLQLTSDDEGDDEERSGNNSGPESDVKTPLPNDDDHFPESTDTPHPSSDTMEEGYPVKTGPTFSESHWCSICKTEYSSAFYYKEHYARCHDLSKLEDPDSAKRLCSQPGCSAYFRTTHQLSVHLLRAHGASLHHRKRKHGCSGCEMRFTARSHLRAHFAGYHDVSRLNKSPEEDVLRCGQPNCTAYFIRPKQLKSHVQRFHHAKNKSSSSTCCPICKLSFAQPRNLAKHRKSQHELQGLDPAQVQRCNEPSCSAYFRTQLQLEKHKHKSHAVTEEGGLTGRVEEEEGLTTTPLPKFKKESHWCSICRIEYSSAFRYKEHYALCHHHQDLSTVEDPPADSSVVQWCTKSGCSAHFKTRRQLVVHLFRVHGLSMGNGKRRKHACSVCEKYFTEATTLRNHFAVAHQLKSSEEAVLQRCDQPSCTAYFLQRGQLERHRGAAHGKWHECKDCGKEFRLRKLLNKHRRQVHKMEVDLQFGCEVDTCGKRFETEEELGSHKNYWHNDKNPERVKPVACPKCDKVCNGQDALRAHLERSLDCSQKRSGRSWVCEQCGKAFTEKYRLDLHYKTHAGADSWEFQCSTCGKKCLTKDKLEEHLRTHTGEKPYTCQHCGLSYAHRHNLRIHVNSKHPEAPPDLPRPTDKTNFTSRKGVKLKQVVGGGSSKTKL